MVVPTASGCERREGEAPFGSADGGGWSLPYNRRYDGGQDSRGEDITVMSAIDSTFERLRSKNEKALIPYIMAGDPYLERTGELVLEMAKAGADIIELGVPFSDPIADGPVIQRAAQRALKWKTSLRDILQLVQNIRTKTDIPIVLMTYYNPLLKSGNHDIFERVAVSGVDGVIIPDLPHEEGAGVMEASRRYGVDWILLAAPTTPAGRLRELSRKTRGFLYYVSLTGITGALLPKLSEVGAKLSCIRRLTDKPVAVGFGISTPEQARALSGMADGVIVGSAIVRLMEKRAEDPDLPAVIGGFVKHLKKAMNPPGGRRKTKGRTAR